jgi:protein-S-isoprenylcysteine O-methyltransferase Ste14
MNVDRTTRSSESGRVVEALLELLILIAVVPPLVCCALQGAFVFVGIIVPWVALVTITALVCVGLGALALGRRQLPPPDPRPIPPPGLPPIRRPPGIPDRRRPDRHGG